MVRSVKIIQSRNQREGLYIGYHIGKHQRSGKFLERVGIDRNAKIVRRQFFTDGYSGIVSMTVLNKARGMLFYDTITSTRPLTQRG